MTVPAEIIASLDALNVHARAYGCGSNAIYRYKTLAAIIACAGHSEMARPVGLISKCTGCDGTGRFKFWDGGDGGICRRCSPGTRGYQRLRFVETTIGDVRWHHPWHNGGSEILLAAWGARTFGISADSPTGFYDTIVFPDDTSRKFQIEDPGDWTPRQPGQVLATDDAARHLTAVETWLFDLDPIADLRWKREHAIAEMCSYKLRLDRVADLPCCFCGTTEGRLTNIGCFTQFLDFGRRCCDACHPSLTSATWPKEPPPQLITPAVQAWLDVPERARRRENGRAR